MSTPTDPQREHPSTYFVQDRSNEEEMRRLQIQDQMITSDMGGVLPEQDNPASFHRVLDVACGVGYWLIELAKAYPTMTLLIGVDVSASMVEYAREQAKAEGVAERVEFHTMDALRMLEFPNNYFDLANERVASSFLRTWDWPKFLQELLRVTRPDGTIRLTEVESVPECNSAALSRLFELMAQAFYQSGHTFTPDSSNQIDEIVRLTRQAGLRQIQTRPYIREYRGGTPEGQHFAEDMQMVFRTIAPFVRKWVHVSEDYDVIYQQAVNDMQQPDFVGTGRIHTIWGIK